MESMRSTKTKCRSVITISNQQPLLDLETWFDTKSVTIDMADSHRTDTTVNIISSQ